MNTRPLLMTGALVLKSLDLHKTETRRLTGLEAINENPDSWKLTRIEEALDEEGRVVAVFTWNNREAMIACPYGGPGDRLWVRESWYVGQGYDGVKPADLPMPTQCSIKVGYKADELRPNSMGKPTWAGKDRPSIHMPAWLCRLKLVIGSVKVERIQDITDQAAHREGMETGRFQRLGQKTFNLIRDPKGTYRDGFRVTWCQMHGADSWERNDWVWVLKFKKL